MPPESSPEGVCLVTGATGFIGARLTRRLLEEGYPVRCLARASSRTAALEALAVEIVLGDLTDPSSLARAAQGARHVVHCAALVSDWATTRELRAINVQGTSNLLKAAVEAGVERFVHMSTTDVYGHPGGPAVDETFKASRFHNWYAQTKLAAEGEVRRAERAAGLDAVILRPATVYGPGSEDVIGEIARAIQGGHMLLIAGGRPIAGLCYVENLIDAALLAVGDDAASGQVFNVSDGTDVTWRQFTDDLATGLGRAKVRWSLPYPVASTIGFGLEHSYRLLRRSTGLQTPPLLSRQAVQVLGRDQNFSNRKLRDVLGWEPRVDYPAGLEMTLAWLKEELLPA